MNKIKNWFKNRVPAKRRLIQIYAALLFNANLKGFVSGEIYKGNTKSMCVPGMNCYSCPGAVGACPLGSLQNAIAEAGSTKKFEGLYYVMGESNGSWSAGGFGDRGWLAIALVIFAVWRPTLGILGSYLFGALFILHNYIDGISMKMQPIIQMSPYVITLLVLIIVSMRKKRENQPPAALGLNYYREDR